jgi:hypothetical protein
LKIWLEPVSGNCPSLLAPDFAINCPIFVHTLISNHEQEALSRKVQQNQFIGRRFVSPGQPVVSAGGGQAFLMPARADPTRKLVWSAFLLAGFDWDTL